MPQIVQAKMLCLAPTYRPACAVFKVVTGLPVSPLRIYPFSQPVTFNISDDRASASPKRTLEESPKTISIDPLVSFGRPTIAGTGVATNIITGRFNAGESIAELAKDYDISKAQVEEAVNCEGITRRAA